MSMPTNKRAKSNDSEDDLAGAPLPASAARGNFAIQFAEFVVRIVRGYSNGTSPTIALAKTVHDLLPLQATDRAAWVRTFLRHYADDKNGVRNYEWVQNISKKLAYVQTRTGPRLADEEDEDFEDLCARVTKRDVAICAFLDSIAYWAEDSTDMLDLDREIKSPSANIIESKLLVAVSTANTHLMITMLIGVAKITPERQQHWLCSICEIAARFVMPKQTPSPQATWKAPSVVDMIFTVNKMIANEL